jgi:hypothetical protein
MAGRARGKRRPKKQAPRSKRQLRLLWLLALVAATTYFYYQPLSSYVDTRNELRESQAEVETLRIVKADLEGRLRSSTSLDATKREARRIGYVLPGEQLFVIKGIPNWRRAQRTLRRDG